MGGRSVLGCDCPSVTSSALRTHTYTRMSCPPAAALLLSVCSPDLPFSSSQTPQGRRFWRGTVPTQWAKLGGASRGSLHRLSLGPWISSGHLPGLPMCLPCCVYTPGHPFSWPEPALPTPSSHMALPGLLSPTFREPEEVWERALEEELLPHPEPRSPAPVHAAPRIPR